MEITLNKKDNTEGLVTIRITPDDYQAKVDEKIRDYSRKASIKGFRPGKVPQGVIKRMFGKSVLVEEINTLLSSKLNEYLQTNKIRIIGEPLPVYEKSQNIDWDTQKDFEFDYQIGIVDDFTVALNPNVKVTSFPISVDEKVIDETIADLKKRFGKVNYPETAETGDNIFGELQSVTGDFKKEAIYVDSSKLAKKQQKLFSGAKKEDEVTFAIESLFEDSEELAKVLDIPAEEAKNLHGEHRLKITNISRTEPAELNQELFDRVFGKDTVHDEAGFREKIRETISGNYQRETQHFLDHHIEDHFIKETKIDLPNDFLKTWLKSTGKGEITDEVLAREFDDYVRSLKWDLIKNKIAEDNQLSVETAEVQAQVQAHAKDMIISQFGGPAIAEQLSDRLDAITDNYLSHENGQNFMRLYNQLRHDKILKHIKANITVQEKKVSLDEFKKIVEEHRH
ncbi:MAG: trigger factor [Cyclobacteriaceae bacterium]|nr:trigger factor [Cyclobacteriaceae bacterium]